MRMRVSRVRVCQAIVMICTVMIASLAYAQATSTFNGRVVDQGDAVLPGVTVTVTNSATGVVRTTVSNAEGQYFLPGLEPGTYQVKTELAGFAESLRDNVRLGINATITIDFKLALQRREARLVEFHSSMILPTKALSSLFGRTKGGFVQGFGSTVLIFRPSDRD